MRRYPIVAARAALLALAVLVLWQLPDRAGEGFIGLTLDERDNAMYFASMDVFWPPLSVALLWVVYLLIVRLTRSRVPTS